MKKSVLLSLILLITLTFFSQTTPKIIFGPVNENSNVDSYNFKAIGSDENAIYSRQRALFPSGIIIKHNKALKFLKKNKIELKNGRDIEFIRYFNNKIYVFSLELNKKKKRNSLYAQTVNKETLELNDDEKKIIDVEYTSNNRFFGMRLKEYDFGSISPDGSKLVVSHMALGSAMKYRKKPEKINNAIYVFDADLNLLWNQPKLSANELSFLDNDGNFYTINDQSLISVTNNGRTKEEHVLDSSKERFYYDYRMKINSAGEIICGGLYKNGSAKITRSDFDAQGYKHFSDGTFLVKFNLTNKKFTNTVFDEYNSPQENYHIKDLILTEDGSITLMEEFYRSEVVNETVTQSTVTHRNTTGGYLGTSQGPTNRSRKTTVTHINEDIIVLKRNQGGLELWTKNIEKEQRSDKPAKNSFNYLLKGNSLFLVYNELVDKKYAYHMVEVTKFTEEKKSILFSKEEFNLIIIPHFTLHNKTENSLILYGRGKGSHRLLSLTF